MTDPAAAAPRTSASPRAAQRLPQVPALLPPAAAHTAGAKVSALTLQLEPSACQARPGSHR